MSLVTFSVHVFKISKQSSAPSNCTAEVKEEWKQKVSRKGRVWNLYVTAGLAYAIGNTLTLYCLTLGSAALTHVLKSLEPVVVLLFRRLFGHNVDSLTFLAILLVVASAINFSIQEASWSVAIFWASCGANVALSCQKVTAKQIFDLERAYDGKQQSSPADMLMKMSSAAASLNLVALLAQALFMYQSAASWGEYAANVAAIVQFVQQLFLCACLHATYQCMSLLVLENVTVVSHAALNIAKRFGVVALSIVQSQQVNLVVVSNANLAFVALAFFAYARNSSAAQVRARRTCAIAGWIGAFFVSAFCCVLALIN